MNFQTESLFRFGDETTSSVPLDVGPTEWKHLYFIRTQILLLLKHSLWIFLIFALCSFFFFHKYFKNAGRKAKYRPVLDFVLSQPNLAKQVSSFLKQRLLCKKFLFVKQSKKKKRKTILFPYLLWVKLKCCDTCHSSRLYLGDINSRSTEMHSH